jgi:hypothetical protein
MSRQITGKTIFTFFMVVAISIVFSFMETGCEAKSNINHAGQNNIVLASSNGNIANKEIVYSGQVQARDGSLISVNLTIKYPLSPGKKEAVLLRYGGKRMCTCQGAYEGEIDSKKVFSLVSQNGGSFCDKLDILEVMQSKTANNEISYTVNSGDGITIEGGKLSTSLK